MNPIYIRIITALLIISIIISCKKNDADSNADLIVINGYLYEGAPVDSIHLAKTVSFESTDTIYPPVTDARVSISWNNNTFDLQSIGNGYYNYPGSDLLVKEGDSYSISVKYNGKVATSTTKVPKKPAGIDLSDTIIYVDTTFSFTPPGSGNSGSSDNDNGLKITWNNPENNYYYVVIENTDPNARDIERGSDSFFGERPRNFTFRSSPFKGEEYTINAMNLKKYGKQRVKVYRVNQEYADLYENRNQDSRTLSEPITNITNGLGIFTAFSYAESYFTVENEINK